MAQGPQRPLTYLGCSINGGGGGGWGDGCWGQGMFRGYVSGVCVPGMFRGILSYNFTCNLGGLFRGMFRGCATRVPLNLGLQKTNKPLSNPKP